MSKIKGMSELKAAFAGLANQAIKNEKAAVELGANEYKVDVQDLAPFKKGDYRRSIHTEMVQDGVRWVGLVGTNKIQGKQREYGGVIKAKKGPYLTFQIDGMWVRVKQVEQTAQPHFRPPLDQNKAKYQRTILEAMFP